MRYLPLLIVPLLVVMMVLPGTLIAYGPTVNLGTTAPFAILAHTTITNTGLTSITGDVGLDTGSISDLGTLTINGARHIADAVAIQAQTDLIAAYNDAASRTPTLLNNTELGTRTLGPGVYNSGGVLQITGTLTLDAQGDPNAVFIFQSTASLVTAAGSNVNLINQARFCRVFWVVPSFATLGTNSHFVGHLLAYTEVIAVGTGATVEGQLMSRNRLCHARQQYHH
jgi:type VI secretion system secreted protein VgrG